MATPATNQDLEGKPQSAGVVVPLCPPGRTASNSIGDQAAESTQEPSQREALEALLVFLTLHEQVRRRKALETRPAGNDAAVPEAEMEGGEQLTLEEVLQTVADRAVAITGAHGVAIALAENDELVLRAAAGTVRPDLGARIDRDSTFSGACFLTAQIVSCDDTATDARVNQRACQRLGARSMVAVPLCGRRRGIGVLEAFSARPFGFHDSDVRTLSRLAELLLGALTPEDDSRFAKSAEVAAAKLEAARSAPDEERGSVTRRPGMLLLLVCIVIASFAGGVRWLKSSQRAKAMVRKETMAPKPAGTAAKDANPANFNPGATSSGSQAITSPAPPRKSSRLPLVSGIQHWSSADSSTVVLNLEDQVKYEPHRLANPDRIYFDLHDTLLASNFAGKSIEVGDALLKRIRVAQPVNRMTRLVLETGVRADFTVSLEPNPSRLVVEVRKAGANPR